MNNTRTKLLQVKCGDGWKWVFCQSNGRIITTDRYQAALPASSLEYFQQNHANDTFRVISHKELA